MSPTDYAIVINPSMHVYSSHKHAYAYARIHHIVRLYKCSCVSSYTGCAKYMAYLTWGLILFNYLIEINLGTHILASDTKEKHEDRLFLSFHKRTVL